MMNINIIVQNERGYLVNRNILESSFKERYSCYGRLDKQDMASLIEKLLEEIKKGGN